MTTKGSKVGEGSIAYAYPTYQGSGPMTDIPAAALGHIDAVNPTMRQEEQTVAQYSRRARRHCLLVGCPPPPGSVPATTG